MGGHEAPAVTGHRGHRCSCALVARSRATLPSAFRVDPGTVRYRRCWAEGRGRAELSAALRCRVRAHVAGH